jgi:hypothetical protein
MTTISSALAEHGLDTVDLVKIDVEGGNGTSFRASRSRIGRGCASSWLSYTTFDGRLARMRELLESKGFEVTVEEADWELLRLMRVCMLYARRP